MFLYKFFEADDISCASDTPLVPGTKDRTFIIPDGKTWKITKLSGSSNKSSCELDLLYSDDNGVTWKNPFDNLASKLISIHLNLTAQSVEFSSGFEFTGNGTDVLLKIIAKNYNTDSVAEITTWLEGYVK